MTARSLFDPAENRRVLDRIASLRADSPRAWGTLDVARMCAHCRQPLRVALGDLKLKRGLIGVLFGGLAKRQLLAPGDFKRGLPTAPEFKVANARELEKERAELVVLVERFGRGGPAALTKEPHPFFGMLTVEQWDTLQWKHLDHHLRQFGA